MKRAQSFLPVCFRASRSQVSLETIWR